MRIGSTNLCIVLLDEECFGVQLGYFWHAKIKNLGTFKKHVGQFYEEKVLLIQQIKRKVL